MFLHRMIQSESAVLEFVYDTVCGVRMNGLVPNVYQDEWACFKLFALSFNLWQVCAQ